MTVVAVAALATLADPLARPAMQAAAASATTFTRLYADGAPAGFSGGFGEQSCHGCHFHAEPNSGDGKVALENVPATFTAGERYPIAILLTRPGMKLAGFQLTARFKDDGAQAGTLAAEPDDDMRVGVEVQSGVQYAGHRKEGSVPSAPDNARWSVVWTAPEAKGAVVFHVAANAADADGTAEGDYVYTAVVEAVPAVSHR